ncbi:hypothetical protein Golob_023888 [Gossypium lobatum]|uniref:Uncharacterized protein n=1 Tax=Gossypium lobatum TaxID=34289 RepID=A0A7J8NK93_9ROSI|nr:hypothetical protein [Gossypium lobatum]
MSMVPPIISTSSSKLPLSIPTQSYGVPNELEDIRLLLDQRSEVDFEWMQYFESKIQECIPTDSFANCNIWNVKIPLIVFATVGHLRNHLSIPSTTYDGNLGCKSILARKNKMKMKTMLEMKIKIKMEVEMEMEVMKMMSRNPNHDKFLLIINTYRVVTHIWADDEDDF